MNSHDGRAATAQDLDPIQIEDRQSLQGRILHDHAVLDQRHRLRGVEIEIRIAESADIETRERTSEREFATSVAPPLSCCPAMRHLPEPLRRVVARLFRPVDGRRFPSRRDEYESSARRRGRENAHRPSHRSA